MDPLSLCCAGAVCSRLDCNGARSGTLSRLNRDAVLRSQRKHHVTVFRGFDMVIANVIYVFAKNGGFKVAQSRLILICKNYK